MTYPSAHGSGGFAISHFKKWGATPVEADETHQFDRVHRELHCWSRNSNRWTTYSISPVWHPHIFVKFWMDSIDIHRNFYRSVLRAATGL